MSTCEGLFPHPQENQDTNKEIPLSCISVSMGRPRKCFIYYSPGGIRGIPESEVKQKEAKEINIMNRILNTIINNNFKACSVYGSLPFEKMLE